MSIFSRIAAISAARPKPHITSVKVKIGKPSEARLELRRPTILRTKQQ